jgi:LemA protein
MLQRRHDLVPQLVACVNGAADHERSVQVALAQYRSTQSLGADDASRAAAQQSEALHDVFAVAEGYPSLHADATFAHLQSSLADTEDRIAAAREFYNESATTLRDRVHTFPGVLLARFGDFDDRPLFAAAGFERSVPSVELELPTDGAAGSEQA